jgi:CBS domain-containing protein
MDIADIAVRDTVEVAVDERLAQVRSLFERENPKGVLVTADGAYEGVITERQLLSSHMEDDTKASAVSKNAPRIDRTADVREVARVLVEGGVKVAPVFEAEALWGIITEDAILEAVLENLGVLQVEQIMTEDVVTLGTDATVGRAINQLREHGISRLPVVTPEGGLDGVVTTHDIVDVVVREENRATRGDRAGDMERMVSLPVADIMSRPVETVEATATVDEAVASMLAEDYSGLVVESERAPIAGVVTKTDVLRALTYTEEEHMDVQVTNVALLSGMTRGELVDNLEAVAEKYSDMQVQHAHVRFAEHKERLRGTPLMYVQIRLRTDVGQIAGTGEGYGADTAFRVALDKLERNVIELKGVQADEEYEGNLLRKLDQL